MPSVPAERGLQDCARSGQDHRVAAQGDRRGARQTGGWARRSRRCGPGARDWKPGLPSSALPGLRCRRQSSGQEREAGDAALGAQARPAARCARPRPHPAANARGEGGAAGAAGGRARMFLLRQALCRERRAFLVVIEIAVKAHIRRIVRPRYRRGCDCASSPLEVTAPPPARLFPRTPYGTSVWARILYERFACFRPCARSRRG